MRAPVLPFVALGVVLVRAWAPPSAPARPSSRLGLQLPRWGTSAPRVAAPDELEAALARRDAGAVVHWLRASDAVTPELAAACLDTCAAAETRGIVDPVTGESYSVGELTGRPVVSADDEKRLLECYRELRRLKLARRFGAEAEAPLPVPEGWVMSAPTLEEQTGLSLAAFRPNPATGRLYWLGAAAVSGAEVAVATQLGLSPQPLLLATLGLLGLDQALLGGAMAETALMTLQPELGKRVVYHEAGHLLLAYLLGCPVQGIALSARDALVRGAKGPLSPGTSFFDVDLNLAAKTGTVTRRTIDRFSIVVMGGIASEAMIFGAAEGGRDDEAALVQFLRQTQGSASGAFSMDRAAEQARWSAVNAIKLLERHRGLYDRLVTILEDERGGSIGRCIIAMEADASAA